MKIISFLFWIVYSFIFFTSSTFASFSFTVPQTSINEDQEIEANVNLSIKGQANKVYYLEGAIKRGGGNNYFGQTWNDTDWVGYTSTNEDKSIKSITTTPEGSWSGVLKIRLDVTSSQFTGSGNYILKLNRFTSSGSSSTPSDNEITLAVAALSTPTSTPAPADTLTPSWIPTPTRTPTTTPTEKPSPTPTPKLTKTPTPSTINSDSTKQNLPPSILGTSSAQATSTETPAPQTRVETFSFKNIFLFSIVAILALGAILTFTFIAKKRLKEI